MVRSAELGGVQGAGSSQGVLLIEPTSMLANDRLVNVATSLLVMTRRIEICRTAVVFEAAGHVSHTGQTPSE